MKTILDLWDEYESQCLAEQIPDELRAEMGMAFHSGVVAALSQVAEISGQARSTEDRAAMIGELFKQAEKWLIEAIARHRSADPVDQPQLVPADLPDEAPEAIKRLASRMGDLGKKAGAMFSEAAGEDVGFIMVIFAGNSAMCGGNANSDQQATQMLQASMSVMHEALEHRFNSTVENETPETIH